MSKFAKVLPDAHAQECAESDAIKRAEDEFEAILYHLTHDLRASMRAFKIIPDWIVEDLQKANAELPGCVLENLGMLKDQGCLTDQLLVDLLTFSRVGRKSAEPAWHKLDVLIGEAIQEAKVPETFEVEVSLQVDVLFLPGNDLKTMFVELLHNAWWHHGSDTGRIQIETIAVREIDDSNWVKVVITDDGQGVPTGHHERVFGMLNRLQPRDTHAGSGMGLTTVRKIVRYLGGDVHLSPGQRTGARVEAMFPIQSGAGAHR